jgi:hypothetical protein
VVTPHVDRSALIEQIERWAAALAPSSTTGGSVERTVREMRQVAGDLSREDAIARSDAQGEART